ncbi:MAG: dTDP-4-dehydrorhamnose reductase [Bacteroidia bacterium]|nr:dTDP-4-dehydrorhamnose reductase [Bacteroidia bacterium]
MSLKVIVTGADGQLAECIKVLYRSHQKAIHFNFVSKDELDITDQNNLGNYFKDHSFDYCINCAAYTNVDGAEDDPETAFLINAEAVGYLAEACQRNKVVLIHLSTDYVFDGTKNEAYTIHDQPNPINVYGASKLEGELKIKEHLEKYYIIRASWLYSDHGKNFLKTIIRKLEMNEDLNIVDTQLGSPTSCYELARFIFFIIISGDLNFGIYHFGTTNSTNWFEFAKRIASYFPSYDGSRIKGVSNFPSRAKRPANSVLSTKEIESIYDRIDSWENSLDKLMKKMLSKQ